MINQLAAKELLIARYYIKNEKWIPAINRLKVVVEKYDKTIFIEEALFEIIGIKNAKIKELRGKKTIYEISTNFSIKNINLRLESKSLRLIKAESVGDLYKVESY